MRTGYLTLHASKAHPDKQVALANIAISGELLIKAYLARKDLSLVLSDLSPEDQVAFHSPKKFSVRERSSTAIKLKFREFRSKELSECLSMLYAFRPKVRSTYGSHLNRIGRIRNGGVHSAITPNATHDVDRAAFVVLKLNEELGKSAGVAYTPTKDDAQFLKRFSTERVEAVQRALDAARKRFHSKDFKPEDHDSSDWDSIPGSCPVCDCKGELHGETIHDAELGYKDEYDESLTFNAYAFTCTSCGLKLEDEEALRLAGVEREVDRSEDLDRWHEESFQNEAFDDR